jgi:hypothetical protein
MLVLLVGTLATELRGPIDYLRPMPVVEKLGAVFLTGYQEMWNSKTTVVLLLQGS